MRKRIWLGFVAIGCLMMTAAPPAQASHYPGHDCSVEIARLSAPPICVPPFDTIAQVPQKLYAAITEAICRQTGQGTPVVELPREIICAFWVPPEYCPL